MIVDAGGAYLKKKNSFWASDNKEVMLNGRQYAQRGRLRAKLEVLKRDNRQMYVISQELGVEKSFPRKENVRPTEKEQKQVNRVSEPMALLKKSHMINSLDDNETNTCKKKAVELLANAFTGEKGLHSRSFSAICVTHILSSFLHAHFLQCP